MTEILTKLADQTGLNMDQVRKGLGSVLSFLKEHLPEQAFAKLESAVPGSAQMLAEAPPEAPAESGGILAQAAGWVSSLFGGTGGAAQLIQRLSQLGLSAEQIQSFLPKVVAFLKDKLPPEIAEKVAGLIPGADQPAEAKG
jgi:uncharacterized protein (DUF2267 family)